MGLRWALLGPLKVVGESRVLVALHGLEVGLVLVVRPQRDELGCVGLVVELSHDVQHPVDAMLLSFLYLGLRVDTLKLFKDKWRNMSVSFSGQGSREKSRTPKPKALPPVPVSSSGPPALILPKDDGVSVAMDVTGNSQDKPIFILQIYIQNRHR
ncbi:uncharacterized protein A4U43_C03F9040 [Asparagus officinalis]|uniref:Uncharacterized protein n=1 Tax=Asparagus officinalis TaxID=4686 RepID=A0A5P1FDR3_ASPOF|nr:uncharacterized protein A4U43_C03F9040 [Asparagus officinalis]